MSELLLVNPRRKKRVHKRRRARKLSALQQQYFGKRKSTHRRRRRTATLLASNPAPVRRRRRRSGAVRRVRRVAAARVGRLRGFNPSSFLSETLLPSAIGAGGALGADVALGYLGPHLPSFMTTGIGAPLTKIAAAVGLGMVAGMVADRRVGEQVMAGGVTVVLYQYLRSQIAANFPSLTLGRYSMGYAGPALAYPDRLHGMGMYVSDQPVIPAAVANAIAANAAATVAGKTAPAAQTVGEYVSGYERDYMY